MSKNRKQFINRQKVSELCKEMDITQRQLANECGIPEGTMRHCLTQRSMSLDNIRRIANRLSTTSDYLMDLSDEKHPEEESELSQEWNPFFGIIKTMIEYRHPIFPSGYIGILEEMRNIFDEQGESSFRYEPDFHVIRVIQKALLQDYEHQSFELMRLKKAVETKNETLFKRIENEFKN